MAIVCYIDPAVLEDLADRILAWGEIAFLPESGGIGDNLPAVRSIADNDGPAGQAFAGTLMELVAGEAEELHVGEIFVCDILAFHDHILIAVGI